MTQAKLVAALVLAGLLLIFTVQNYETVEVRFLFWSVEMSRAIMLFGVLVVGIVLGWLTAEIGRGRKRHPS